MTTTPPSQTAGIAVGKGSTHHLTLDWRPLCGATGTLGLKAGSKDVADLERRYLICERCQRTTAYASVREQLVQPAGYDPDQPYDTETQRRKRERGELPPLPAH